MKKNISIITINYNNLAGLEKTVQSVVHQTYSDYEYIIIDGGSTDGSCQFLETHKKKFSYLVSEPDAGIYNAMNKGIKASKGEYLLFLNSGDVLNGVTALSDFINNPLFSGDIIYGDYQFEKSEKIYPDILTPLFFIKTSLPHQSTFFKRSIFDKMGFYSESYKISADRAFYIDCFLSGKFKFTHIEYFLSIYDLNGLSNSVASNTLKEEEDTAIFKKYYGVFFQDYLKYLALEEELSRVRKLTLGGILKRIKNKIKAYANTSS
ncbi:MAG: glycosyltransferase family 2 protein [Polaribacter sp.]|uniref:glycosyltransferase family 2 protein n=1 Tax=Polaribacter sp. TaxID=1920175 RepID=UPI003EF78CB8